MKRTLPILAGAGLIVAAALVAPRLVQNTAVPVKMGRLEVVNPVAESNMVYVFLTSTDTVHWAHMVTTNSSVVPIRLDEPRRYYAVYVSNEVDGSTNLEP